MEHADPRGMGQFIDDQDVRRPFEMPRMGERYPIPGLRALWHPPSRRLGLRGKMPAAPIKLIDISVAGALIEAEPNKKIVVGSRLRWSINDCEGVAEVRNIREAEDVAYYGISYFRMDDDQRALIHQVVAKVRSTHNLSSQWEHRKF